MSSGQKMFKGGCEVRTEMLYLSRYSSAPEGITLIESASLQFAAVNGTPQLSSFWQYHLVSKLEMSRRRKVVVLLHLIHLLPAADHLQEASEICFQSIAPNSTR